MTRALSFMRESHLLQAEEAERRITAEVVGTLLKTFHGHLPDFPDRFQRGIFWNAPNLHSRVGLVDLAKKISGELDLLVRSLDAINAEKLKNQRKYEEATAGFADTYLTGKEQAAMDWCSLQDAEGTSNTWYTKTEAVLTVPTQAVRNQMLLNLGNTFLEGRAAEEQVNSILDSVSHSSSKRSRMTAAQFVAAWSEARRLALDLPRLSDPLNKYAEVEAETSSRTQATAQSRVNWGTRSACEPSFLHQVTTQLSRIASPGKLHVRVSGDASHAEL